MNGHTNHQGQPQHPSLPKKMQPRKSKEIEGVMIDRQGDSSLPKKMQPRKSKKIEGVMIDGQGDSSLPKKMQPRKSKKNRRSYDRWTR